jgi:hypothetical protein
VVTLVAFDLKGAFNGVKKLTLDIHLRNKGILYKARKWVQSFIKGRSANIKFNNFKTDIAPLKNARLS